MVEFIFNDTHFDKFEESLETPLDRNKRGGKNVRAFAQNIKDVSAEDLKNRTVCHEYVVKRVESKANIKTQCAVILAWGGMRYSDRNALFDQKNQGWVDVAEDIQKGKITRKGAFEEFSKRRKDGDLKGMGCAYFTKLIYFLQFHPKSNPAKGYIMDQWVAEAVNLLVEGSDIVKLDTSLTLKWKGSPVASQSPVTSSLVSDKNTGQDYEIFCAATEALRSKINEGREKEITRAELDRALGGSSKAHDNDKWRPYVKEQRLKTMLKYGNSKPDHGN